MMIDEIQTGFGRTGRWFGFEHSGVAPDVVTLAKAMGNGMPVGACWARRDVAAVFQPGDHGSTYSGTAIATAAVVAVIDEMRRIDAPALARQRGAFLRELVSAIPGVTSVRGDGSAARRPARRRHRRSRRLHAHARERDHLQRRQPDHDPVGTAADGHRGRARPRRRTRSANVLEEGQA